MDGCPECGSQRLKSAPLALVSTLARVASVKRRYRCSDCQWTGWRHRLQRMGGASRSDQVFDGHEIQRREVWYFVVVTVAFVLFLGVIMKQCADEAPVPPENVSRLKPSGLAISNFP